MTAAEDLDGVTTLQELAQRLALVDGTEQLIPGPFAIIVFDAPEVGMASPIRRLNPGFSGKGRTTGDAREFVVPNLPIHELKNASTSVML